MLKIWPILQAFLAPIAQPVLEAAVPIAEGAVNKVFEQVPSLSPFQAIANALIEGAAEFGAQSIAPEAAAVAVSHAVNKKLNAGG